MSPRTCSECGVRDRALCAALSDVELASLSGLGVQRRLVRGETLVRAGDPPLVCANLQSGVMKLSAVTASGEEAITGLLFPGDFIGRPFMGSAAHDIVALTDVELCVFPRAAFERALSDHRRMEQLLLERTLAELDRARRSIVSLGRASAGARVAGFLDDIARRMATSGCQPEAGPQGRSFDLPFEPRRDRRCAGPDHRDRQPPDDPAAHRRPHRFARRPCHRRAQCRRPGGRSGRLIDIKAAWRSVR